MKLAPDGREWSSTDRLEYTPRDIPDFVDAVDEVFMGAAKRGVVLADVADCHICIGREKDGYAFQNESDGGDFLTFPSVEEGLNKFIVNGKSVSSYIPNVRLWLVVYR